MSDSSGGPGWWQASDGKWYPPQGAGAPPTAQPGTTQQAPAGYAPRPVAKTNVLAIIALICGILWGFGLLAAVALVLGIIAIRQIKRTGERGRGLATAGIVLGALGIVGAIIATVAVFIVAEEISTRPASLQIEAAPDVCWVATLTSPELGLSESQQENCGSATFDLGGGEGRKAVVTQVSGAGTLTAVIAIDGGIEIRESTDADSDTLTINL